MSKLISISSTKIQFSENPGINAGDIVIGSPSEINPYGFLRKVEGISGQSYSTSDATFEDIIKSGSFKFSTNELIPASKLPPGIKQTVSERGIEYEFNGALYENGSINGKIILSNILSGEIGIKGGFYAKVEDNFLVHSDFHFLAEENANYINQEINLLNFSFGTISIPTTPPVFITPQFSLVANMNGHLEGKIETFLLDDFRIHSELSYESYSWSKQFGIENSFVIGEPTISLNAQTHLGLEASLSFLFYGMAGPAFIVEPYTEFEVDVNSTPWWELYGGLTGKVKIETSRWLGRNILEKEWPLFTERELIKASSGGNPPNANFTVSSTNVSVDEMIQFTDISSNNPTYWHWNFGDNTTNSIVQNPTHSYSTPGDYTITFGVSNDYGEDFETRVNYIHVESGGGGNTFIDPRDGQTYNIVMIGSQTWFAENLNYETNNSWLYNNNSANGNIYGRLYTWEAARNACPNGWHLPSDTEWKILEMYLGMSQGEVNNLEWRGTNEGGKIKEAGTLHWNSPNTGANNNSEFTALPGGTRNTAGSYWGIGFYGAWWTRTETSSVNAWDRLLDSEHKQIYRIDHNNKSLGFSVRCVRD